MLFIDLTGKTFTNWTVLQNVAGAANLWLCRCACGNERVVRGNNLRSGRSRSCGCLRREVLTERVWYKKAQTSKRQVSPDCSVLLPGARGLYTGKHFARNLDMDLWHVDAATKDVLIHGPSHPAYAFAWQQALKTAYAIDFDGSTWRLRYNPIGETGLLFAVKDKQQEVDCVEPEQATGDSPS